MLTLASVENSVRARGHVVQGLDTIKGLEDSFHGHVISEGIKLSFKHQVDALESCHKDDKATALQHLVASGLSGKYTDKGLDAHPDGAHHVTGMDEVEIRLPKVASHSLEGNVIVTIAIVDHSPEG
jgi:hypothetical protein